MLDYMRRGKGFYRDVFMLAMPIILQNLIMTGLGMVDTFMVGILGEAPMAAVTIANAPIYAVDLLVFGLMSGSQVLISQYWGKQDREAINRVFGIGIMLSCMVTIAFSVVCIAIPREFMALFCNDQSLIDLAAQYLRFAGPSYIFHGCVGVYVGAYRGMESPKIGLYIFTAAVCINTFLNWILIFGRWGFPSLGVEGAALATFISRVIEFVIMLVHIKTSKFFKVEPKLVVAPGMPMVKRFIKYCTPVVINETMWGLGTSMYPTIMGHMENSKEILAAFTIAGNVEKVCTVAIFGVAAAAATIIGREIGRGKKDNVYHVGKALVTVAFAVGMTISIIMIILIFTFIEPYIYPLFKLSPMSAEISTMMIFFTFAFVSFRGTNSSLIVGVLRGGGDVKRAALIDILPLWLVAIPMAAFCGIVLKKGILWVCLAMVVEIMVKFVLGIHRFRSKKWINDVTSGPFDAEEITL